MEVATSTASTYAILSAFQMISMLGLTEYMWPRDKSAETDNCDADFIIVGGGTAGSIVANGLAKNENVTVAVLEAGGDPPIESVFAGLLNYLPHSRLDYNFTSQDDGRTARGQKNNTILALAGKLLGGSSSVDHMLYGRGCSDDYDQWAVAAKDESWNFDGLYKYFKQNQNVKDAEIMNSSDSQFHGSDGYLEVSRQLEDIVKFYLSAFKEIGYDSILDLSANNSKGFAQPLLTLSSGKRQSNAYAFLNPIKDKSNLMVFKNHVVTGIIFNGTVAVGVKALNKDNKEVTCKASKEVILSAGTFNSAKILMLSGVGPKTHLESLGISVLVDLPVGEKLFDYASVKMFYKMEASHDLAPQFNPTLYPVPSFVGQVAMNKSQSCADYHALGILFLHDSAGFIPLCSHVENFNDDICQAVAEANVGHTVLWVHIADMHPQSVGKLRLLSADPGDNPLIYFNSYTVQDDLTNAVKYIKDVNRVLDSSYFKNVSAEFINLPLPQCANMTFMSDEYYECYTLAMGATLYDYCGTCAVGSVVDAGFKVIGIEKLRVIDAGVIPAIVGSFIKEGVNALAAMAVDVIKKDYSLN